MEISLFFTLRVCSCFCPNAHAFAGTKYLLFHTPHPPPGPALLVSKACNVDRYNVLTGEWTELDTVQETNCHSDHSGVASGNDTIYLFGGYTHDYQAQNTVVKVQISGDDELSFSTVEPMSIVSLSMFFVFVYRLYVVLGVCLRLGA